jgi:hypothetical protein
VMSVYTLVGDDMANSVAVLSFSVFNESKRIMQKTPPFYTGDVFILPD